MKFKPLNWAVEKIVKFSHQDDLGKVLNVTGTIGWAASSAAFTGAVALNEDIPKEQKKFLIPQEIFDGIVNCTLFFTCTKIANDRAKKMVKDGKVFPLKLKKEINEIKAKVGKAADLKTIEQNLSPENLTKMKHFKKSFPALVSVTGSAIAANIITPFARNFIASKFQEKHIAKTKTINLTQGRPQKHNSMNYKGVNMEQYLTQSRSGSLRV